MVYIFWKLCYTIFANIVFIRSALLRGMIHYKSIRQTSKAPQVQLFRGTGRNTGTDVSSCLLSPVIDKEFFQWQNS